MISKGKRQNLVRTFACLDFIRKMGLPNGSIDVFGLCARAGRLAHIRQPRTPEPFDYDKFLATAMGSCKAWDTVGKISLEIGEEILRRQEQQLVHKPRVVVVREIDHSDPTLPQGDGYFYLPFPEKGPL